MGSDKSALEIEGDPLAVRAVRMLRTMCDEVIVASGDGQRVGWLGEGQIADAIPDAGPLGGIVAGLEVASTELVAVLAVDMPYASAGVLQLLADRCDGHDAAVARTDDGLEPLHAVFATRAAPALRAQLERGERAVHRALRSLDVLEIGPDEWSSADPSGRFAVNLNRPEDLPATGSSS
jgi:molybdenum cofactor guanylyltransferase